MNEQELLKLKSDIDNAKIKLSELTGQQKSLTAQLEEYGCKTISEAEKKLKEMTDEVSIFNNKITLGIKELKEKYNV